MNDIKCNKVGDSYIYGQEANEQLARIASRRDSQKPLSVSFGVSEGRKKASVARFKQIADRDTGPKKRRTSINFTKDNQQEYDPSQGIHAEERKFIEPKE